MQDLRLQSELGRDRSIELIQAKELTVKLEDKYTWMLNQLDGFGSYFKARKDHKLLAKYVLELAYCLKSAVVVYIFGTSNVCRVPFKLEFATSFFSFLAHVHQNNAGPPNTENRLG